MSAQSISLPPEDPERLRESFGFVLKDVAGFTGELYDRLFEAAPETRSLFQSDLTEQEDKLLKTLALVVQTADRLWAIEDRIRELGISHVNDYGVADEHYEIFRDTLIATFRARFGSTFTPAHEAAWMRLYGALAALMKG